MSSSNTSTSTNNVTSWQTRTCHVVLHTREPISGRFVRCNFRLREKYIQEGGMFTAGMRNNWKTELRINRRRFSDKHAQPKLRKDSRTYTWMGLGKERTCVRAARRSEYETRRHASRSRKAPILVAVAQLHRRGYGAH